MASRNARSAATASRRLGDRRPPRAASACPASSARHSRASAPCPTAGSRTSVSRGRAAGSLIAEAREPRGGEQQRVDLAGRATCASRVSTLPRRNTTSRSRRRARSCARRRTLAVPMRAPGGEPAEPVRPAADQHVARVGTWRDGADREPGGERRRHVLHGVHRAVDAPVRQRLLELLHEQSLAADRRERPLGQAVAAGADQHRLDDEPGVALARGRRRPGRSAPARARCARVPTRNGCASARAVTSSSSSGGSSPPSRNSERAASM